MKQITREDFEAMIKRLSVNQNISEEQAREAACHIAEVHGYKIIDQPEPTLLETLQRERVLSGEEAVIRKLKNLGLN